MKFFFILTCWMLIGLYASAQNINRRLFEAIGVNDTLNVETLLNQGADANYQEKVGSFDKSMLILAVTKHETKVVKLLLAHKVKVNERDAFNSTALMYAVNSADMDIIRALIINGADIRADDGQGNTILSVAKGGKHPEVIKLIEELLKY